MEPLDLVACMCDAIINYPERTEEAGTIPWMSHPAFQGVFLKHLVIGKDSGNSLSCHLVRVDPGMELGEHIHEGQWELHEVIQGSGTCRLGTRDFPYAVGRMTVIPQGMSHSVRAGQRGLILLAKFFPALV